MILHHFLPSAVAAAASSLSPFSSPRQVCLHESRQAPPEDDADEEAMQYSLNNTIQTNKKKKNVRFNDVNVEFYDCGRVIREEDCSNLWYSALEIHRFKDANMDFAGQVAFADRQKKGNDECSYQNVLKRTYQACCLCSHETDSNILTRHEEKHLIKWLDCEPNRLGTERKTIAEIGRDRRYRRSRIMDLVLIIQETMRKNNGGNANGTSRPDADAMARVMSDSCQQVSRPSRLFARHLAMAQAASAC